MRTRVMRPPAVCCLAALAAGGSAAAAGAEHVSAVLDICDKRLAGRRFSGSAALMRDDRIR